MPGTILRAKNGVLKRETKIFALIEFTSWQKETDKYSIQINDIVCRRQVVYRKIEQKKSSDRGRLTEKVIFE